MKTSNPTESIEHLELERHSAFAEWDELNKPARVAWKKYEAAAKKHRDAVLYEKAKREVMRDLIKSAGVLNGGAL